jgi:arylformamidase
VIGITGRESIRAADLSCLEWEGGERVLFKTQSANSSAHEFDRTFTYLEEDASEFLSMKQILLIGTDAPSVDRYDSADLRSHKILMDGGVAILEGVRLADVPAGDYNLVCVPLKIAGADGSPVRAVLWR